MIKGYLKYAILEILSKREASGYDIIKIVYEKTGIIKPSAGAVYPTLNSLREEGLISYRKEGRRKVYYLTKKGKQFAGDINRKKRTFYTKVVKKLKLTDPSNSMLKVLDYVEKNNEFAKFLPKIINLCSAVYKLSFKNKDDAEKLNRIKSKLTLALKELKEEIK